MSTKNDKATEVKNVTSYEAVNTPVRNLWLAIAGPLASIVVLIEIVIRGHVEWVHVVGSSVSIATAVVLAGWIKSRQ